MRERERVATIAATPSSYFPLVVDQIERAERNRVPSRPLALGYFILREMINFKKLWESVESLQYTHVLICFWKCVTYTNDLIIQIVLIYTYE